MLGYVIPLEFRNVMPVRYCLLGHREEKVSETEIGFNSTYRD